MNDAQTDITESHAGNILCLRHSFAGNHIITIIDSRFQIGSNHFNSLQFKHIRHSPSPRSYVAFDSMRQGIHTCCRRQTLRHRIHQFRIYNCHSRNIIGVYTNHLLLCIFINYHIINSDLSRSSCRCGQSKSRNSLIAGCSHTFQRFHICKIRIIHYNANAFCRINGRASTQSHNKISTRCLKSIHTFLHISNSRISFYIAEKLIRNMILLKNFNNLICYLEFNQVLVCHKKCFLETSAHSFHRDCLATACSKIRGFVQYHPIHNYALLLFR